MSDPADDLHTPITQILDGAAAGDRASRERLLQRVYHELHSMAARLLSRESHQHTVQATVLVHDAWFRLMGDEDARFDHRRHFFGAAATAMRRVLVEAARHRQAHKRGGDVLRVTLSDMIDPRSAQPEDESVLRLHDALAQLEAQSPDLAKLVELRYFAGFSIEQTAETLGRSPATVKREWAFARAWLHERLANRPENDDA